MMKLNMAGTFGLIILFALLISSCCNRGSEMSELDMLEVLIVEKDGELTLSDLEPYLQSEDSEIRYYATLSLGLIEPSENVISKLDELLEDPDISVPLVAIRILEQIGKSSNLDVLPELQNASQSEVSLVVSTTLMALESLIPYSPGALDLLCNGLHSEDSKIRGITVSLLGNSGIKDSMVLQKLREVASSDPSYDDNEAYYPIRLHARIAIAQIEGIEEWRKLAADEDPRVRTRVAEHLGDRVLYKEPEYFDIVIAMLEDDDLEVKLRAIQSIPSYVEFRELSMPLLKEMFEGQESEEIRNMAEAAYNYLENFDDSQNEDREQ